MPLETTAALRVDMLDPGAPQIIHAVQDDSNSRKIAFSIYAGGAQWAVPDGTLVTVRYKKPDGTAGFYDTLPDGSTPAATINGNVVTVALVPQAFTVRGNVPVQIKLYDTAGTSITTFAVVMNVSANVVSDAEVVSSDYYSVLTKQIADVLAAAEGIEGNVTAAQTAATNAENAAAPVLAILSSGAGAHNSIYRGKNLGTSVTAAQWAAIADGSFTDLYIGDYWTIGNVNYRIAAFDYYLNSGDTDCTTHHAVIVPDTVLYNAMMNGTNTTTGGYVGSAMYTANLEQAKTTINSAFSGHVLNHRLYLTNAVANGRASSGAWYDSEVDLMCEQMVYGSGIFSPVSDGGNVPANYRVEKSQLPLFQHEPSRICNRNDWWLRDVITASAFARADGYGYAVYYDASAASGVRPAFSIIG